MRPTSSLLKSFPADVHPIRVLIVLALGQLVGWGAVSLLTVVGGKVAADLGMDIAAVYAGNSVLYLAMGLCAPLLAKLYPRFGARAVLIVGSVFAAPGFVVIAASRGPILYFVGWTILGIAGSAILTTSAYVTLNEIAGKGAKSAIGALMLVTGLSSSIFWPTTALVSDFLGWRGACLLFGAMVLLCAPLYLFGLPGRKKAPADARPLDPTPLPSAEPARSTFYLIVAGIALNAFITFGFSSVLIELLKAEGLPAAEAIAFASSLGVIQVSARVVDFLGGGRWDGVMTGVIAGGALTVSLFLLLAGGGAHWTIVVFIGLYGLGSGAMTVARATIPLAFYDSAAYARAVSHIALPLNVMSAISPPLLGGLLTNFGAGAVVGLAALCSSVALLILLWLRGRRAIASVTAAA